MTFSEINNAIQALTKLNNVETSVIGYSVLGKPIYAFHIGSYDAPQIIVEGGIHAREWISTLLVIELVKYYSTLQFDGGIYFVPLVNPDGVELALDGADNIQDQNLKEFLIEVNGGSQDFSQWKANINAVDLNVNFDALWGGGAQNVFQPSPANFVGYSPNSEPEINALINLTQQVNPALTLSFHSKGEVIYYGFETLSPQQIERDRLIANRIAELNGYMPIQTQNSTGGYPDWISLNYQVPAFTIEVGNASINHPITEQYLPSIFLKNKEVPLLALQIVQEETTQTNSLASMFEMPDMHFEKNFKEKYFLKP